MLRRGGSQKEEAMQRLLWGLLILVLVPLPSSAQTARDSWDNLKQLQPGQRIEVVDMNLKSVVGALVNVSEEGISLRAQKAADLVTVERAKVYRVTSRESSKRLRNALIGAAIGGGLMAIPAGIGGTICSNEIAGKCAGWAAAVVAAGAGAGAGLGAVVPSYPTIYRAKKRP